MAVQTAIMSPTNSTQPVSRNHFFRKLVLLFLLVTAFAMSMLILFRERPDYPAWFQNWFAVATLAVVAGFGSRWVLKRRSGLIRFLGATATYLSGLYLLGFASNWKYGIGPFEFWPSQVDVDGLTQAGVGAYLILLIFVAWRKRPAENLPAMANPQPVPSGTAEPRPISTSRNPSNTSGRKSLWGLLKRSDRPVKLRGGGSRSRKSVKPMSKADAPIRPSKRPFWRGRPKVRLAIVEEHRCPYCLENVSRVDPRGVVECEVCHTLHHKDCWDITGVCQVPHLNT